jgi:hemolysin III
MSMIPRAPSPASDYPDYALSERIADGVIHGFGVAFALAGGVLLTMAAALTQPGGRAVAVGIYGFALVATFVASACYHMTPWDRFRPALRRVDHAAIYLKIAGTYTPLTVLVGGAFAYTVLGVVWVLALAGAVAKMFFWRRPGRAGVLLYLLLGWLGVLLVWPLAAALPPPALILVGAGGLLYTAGCVFFLWDGLKFSNAIWHGFVLAASGCFFAAIAVGTLGAAA